MTQFTPPNITSNVPSLTTHSPKIQPSNMMQRNQDAGGVYTDLSSLQGIQTEGNKDVALKKVAKQFESMFVGMLFKGMRQANAVFEEGNMGHSNAENVYRDMYDQQLSIRISEGRGLGIADMVYKQLKGPDHSQSEAGRPLDHSQLYQADQIDYARSSVTRKATPNDTVSKNKELSTHMSEERGSIDSVKVARLNNKSPEDFIESLLPAVKKVAQKLGLDPLMMVAQAALETGWGKHVIKDSHGNSSNNLFNIKADSRWEGPKVTTKTLEYRDGVAVKESANFRRYDSLLNSLDDFAAFLQANPRYEKALSVAADSSAFIHELQQAGYATDPQYANKIRSVYERISDTVSAHPNASLLTGKEEG